MEVAIQEAKKAASEGEVPVGAVVVLNDKIVGTGRNQMEQKKDGTAHAEILAIQEASANLGRWRLDDCHLYVTLEPCLMCMGAIINSRVKRLIIGASDLKGGGLDLLRFKDHGHQIRHLEVYEGILEEDCARMLQEFFKEKRN